MKETAMYPGLSILIVVVILVGDATAFTVGTKEAILLATIMVLYGFIGVINAIENP